MDLSTEKTLSLHMRKQDAVSPTTPEEAAEQRKFTCPHLNCGFKCGSKDPHGQCEWKDEFAVERIVDHRGPVVVRKFKVRWKNYSSDFETWEPWTNLHPALIREYEIAHGAYDFNWRFRCGM